MKERKEQEYIRIKGARVHNLKNISLSIPHNALVVVTGLSGSGKSTLAFDTIFAEGQRRYVESLSAYARQFLGRIDKPDVDDISGIAPAIAIEQKVTSRNARSTVGTSTEIYDYLKLLFARIGRTYSPVSGREVKCYRVEEIATEIDRLGFGTRVMIGAPVVVSANQSLIERLTLMMKDGIQRIYHGGQTKFIEDIIPTADTLPAEELTAIIDRLVVDDQNDTMSRMRSSIERAVSEGEGTCRVVVVGSEGDMVVEFSTRFEMDGIEFTPPTEHLFSFNNPIGACPECEGYGRVVGIDEDLVVPDKCKSIFEGAIACWRGETMSWWRDQLVNSSHRFGFPIHTPYHDLSQQEKRLLWTGNEYFEGLNAFFAHLEKERYKVQYRVMLSRYTGKTICPKCGGTRLRPEALCVKVGGKNIAELVTMPVDELILFFDTVTLDRYDNEASRRILAEVRSRLKYLADVGLGYLTLDRLSATLSGGESQRINLATSLGSTLTGSLYILDEPSIGLHPRDTHRLIKVLKELRDLGNTVIVVEHEEEVIRAADYIVDVGPRAGSKGGEIVFAGTPDGLLGESESLTADYLCGRREIAPPKSPRGWSSFVEVRGARENNLKGINVRFPLGVMTCVTGVSGSGKSSLVNTILYPALKRAIDETSLKPGDYESLAGDVSLVKRVELIDQNPISKSLRSNPATYTKVYNEIRKLYASQPYAVHNGLSQGHFSFNSAGGRCEECAGEGVIKVEMQFMADVVLTCEHCGGKRFKEEVLEVRYRDKNIYEVLEMTVDEAVEFFGQDNSATNRNIVEILSVLQTIGLGYIKLGQSTSTLSGGELQRIKLASFLLKEGRTESTMFIFDEPTTGLHMHDIQKLLRAFDALIEKGHTIVVVEHNLDVIKCADWLIDLGPEAGDAGGQLVYEGVPMEATDCEGSYTGKFLKERLKGNNE